MQRLCHVISRFHSSKTTSQHKASTYGGLLGIYNDTVLPNSGDKWVGILGAHVIYVLLELHRCTSLSRQVDDS